MVMQGSMARREAVINGALISYYTLGPTAPKTNLIFLHGWRSDSLIWRNVIARLELPDTSIFALDLPGFGGSPLPKEPYDVTAYARIVEEFIRKLALEHIILIGHSFGGRIGIKLTAHSSFIKKLILIDSGGVREGRRIKRVVERIANIVKPLFTLPLLRILKPRLYEMIGAGDYAATPKLRETFVRVVREDLRGDMMKINVPTAILWGEKDKETPLSAAYEIKRCIKNAELTVLLGAGHFPFVDEPEQFTETLTRAIYESI